MRDFADIASLPDIAELPNDRVIVLTGHNGAGKSTLLDILSGELTPDLQPTHSVRADCAYCKQQPLCLSTLTVSENIRFYQSIDPQKGPEMIGNPMDAVDRLGALLTGLLPIRAGLLSGGQLRLLGVLGTCLLGRSIYLFDEPLVGIDPQNAPIVAAAIRSLIPTPTVSSQVIHAHSQNNLHFHAATAASLSDARRGRRVIVVVHGQEQASLFPGALHLSLDELTERIGA